MRSAPQISGKHGSQRVLIVIPVGVSRHVREGEHVNERGETLVVAEDRALLSLASPLPLDTLVEVMNCYSEEKEKFRVVHVDREAKEGRFHVVVEMLRPRDAFWKIRFPSRTRASHS